jgi:hypothetical protein
MRAQTLFAFAWIVFATLALPGCEMFEEQQPSSESVQPPSGELPIAPVLPSYIRLLPNPPPAPVAEIPPAIDDLQHKTWRPGYWSYGEGQFTWVPGAIIDKPAFTAVWLADHWERREYGWAFVPGYWQ